MEHEPPSKKLKWSINFAKHRLEIQEKFSSLINNVDIDTEKILISMNDETLIDKLNKQRTEIIAEIEKAKLENLNNFDKNLSHLNSDLKEADLFCVLCIYLCTDHLSDFILKRDRLGLLIVTSLKIDFLEELFK